MECENCKEHHDGKYGSGRFCGSKCARGFSTSAKREEINKKVSKKLNGKKLSAEHVKSIELATNFNRVEKVVRKCIGCNTEIFCRITSKKKFCSVKCWSTYTEKFKEPYLLYRQQCNFDFELTSYPDKFDLTLVESYGLYSPSNKGNNLNGISKDHMLSVKTGFELGVDPEIIKHPANCQIMPHKQNQSKREKSSITLEQLLERIKNW
jgi:hypothetical protein